MSQQIGAVIFPAGRSGLWQSNRLARGLRGSSCGLGGLGFAFRLAHHGQACVTIAPKGAVSGCFWVILAVLPCPENRRRNARRQTCHSRQRYYGTIIPYISSLDITLTNPNSLTAPHPLGFPRKKPLQIAPLCQHNPRQSWQSMLTLQMRKDANKCVAQPAGVDMMGASTTKGNANDRTDAFGDCDCHGMPGFDGLPRLGLPWLSPRTLTATGPAQAGPS